MALPSSASATASVWRSVQRVDGSSDPFKKAGSAARPWARSVLRMLASVKARASPRASSINAAAAPGEAAATDVWDRGASEVDRAAEEAVGETV